MSDDVVTAAESELLHLIRLAQLVQQLGFEFTNNFGQRHLSFELDIGVAGRVRESDSSGNFKLVFYFQGIFEVCLQQEHLIVQTKALLPLERVLRNSCFDDRENFLDQSPIGFKSNCLFLLLVLLIV